jgi:alpha-maltose-1-phosphate synthase
VIDSAGRLMEDADERDAQTAHPQSRTCEGGCDGVEQDGARPELLGPTKHGRAAKRGERERPLGKREEADPRFVRRRRPGHPLVIEIATAQATGIAERDQRKNEMRVVHVAPTLFGPAGIFGGGERYPLELARALARLVDCELVSFAPEARAWSEPGGLGIRTLRSVTLLGGHPAHPLALGLGHALSEADIVHAHQLRSASSRLAALHARIRRIPTAVTDHGLGGGNWAGLLPRLFDRFLTVSAYSARELAAPASRTRVVYGGADAARFRPDLDARRRGVLFVGRLTPHKGVDCLIEALPEDAELRVVGSGGHDPDAPERDYPKLLRSLAAQRRVEFLGAVADADLPAVYRGAQVLALPSVHVTCYGREIRVSELLGLSGIEAMASGTPVVASSLGGLPEVVEHGVTGFLVEPGNVAELRERLAEILGDRRRAERMGRSARERFLARFTWEACAERCLTAYSELVGSRAR